MNLKLPQLLTLAVGGILIYAAVKSVSPADVIKAVLTGQPLPVPASESVNPGVAVPEPILPSDKGPNPGDSSPRLNDKGDLIPGDPNGAPGGFPTQNPGTVESDYQTPYPSSYRVVSV